MAETMARRSGACGKMAVCLLAAAMGLACCLLAVAPSMAHAATSGNVVDAVITTSDGQTFKVTEADPDDAGDGHGKATLTDATDYQASNLEVGIVSQEIEEVKGAEYVYDVTAIGANALKGNTSVQTVSITSDLTGSTPAIGESAFEGCTSLQTIELPNQVAGIGKSAFKDCIGLTSLSFDRPESGRVYVNSKFSATAIGSGAFNNCKSLKTLVFPALGSERKGDVYGGFSDYNPDADVSLTDKASIFPSGYFNTTGSFPNDISLRSAFTLGYVGTFEGCSSLETVVFKAGATNGALAYFNAMQIYNVPSKGESASSPRYYHFAGCVSLKNVVFETQQSYAGNPNASLIAGTYKDLYASLDEAPTLYYAVNYYASTAVPGDDSYADGRIARVEFARGTSTAAIASSDINELEGSLFAQTSLYADPDTAEHSDGSIPDPNAVAGEMGLDTSKQWVWKLTDTQSRRSGLSESCDAYLAEKGDLSSGRIEADPISALYLACDQNLSKGSVQDTAFDPSRYTEPNRTYEHGDGTKGTDAYTIGSEAYFTLTSDLEGSFYSELDVVAPDGTVLDPDTYSLSFQRYDGTESALLESETFEGALSALGSDGGPLLMTVTPTSESGYSGTLQEWVLVKGNAGSVMERFTQSAAGNSGTWLAATAKSETSDSGSAVYTGPYAVQVGHGDLASALVATGFAGLTGAPINVADSGLANYGFYLAKSFHDTDGAITDTSAAAGQTFPADGDAASFAVKSYRAMESTDGSSVRSKLGVGEEYQWGSTALLIDQNSLNDVAASAAAFAYAAKAPVFYAEADGSVSDDTLSCLGNFDKVLLMGSSQTFTEPSIAAIEAALGEGKVDSGLVQPVSNAWLLSRTVADYLMDNGLATPAVATVSDAADPFDALGALNRSGHDGGITLVCASSADSKAASSYLRNLRDDMNTVRLFGRTEGNALDASQFSLGDSLRVLWDEQGGYSEPSVAEGDTVELSGVRFTIGSGSGTASDPYILEGNERLWGTAGLKAGVYNIGGTHYKLATAVEGTGGNQGATDPEPDPSPDPDNGSSTDLGSLTGSQQDVWSTVTKNPWLNAEKVDHSSQGGAESSTDTTVSGTAATGGTSTTGTTSSGSTTTGTTSTAGTSTTGTSTGTASNLNLNTTLDTSEDDTGEAGVSGVDGTSPDAGAAASGEDDNGWDVVSIGDITDPDNLTDTNEGTSATPVEEAADSGSVPPYVVGIGVAAVVAALGGGVWYLLRRRNDELFDDPLDAVA